MGPTPHNDQTLFKQGELRFNSIINERVTKFKRFIFTVVIPTSCLFINQYFDSEIITYILIGCTFIYSLILFLVANFEKTYDLSKALINKDNIQYTLCENIINKISMFIGYSKIEKRCIGNDVIYQPYHESHEEDLISHEEV